MIRASWLSSCSFLALVVLVGFASESLAQDYTLKISKIEMKKTPQSGTWRAGVSIRQKAEPDNRDSWHGGETEFEGAGAVLPAKLELGGLSSGEEVVLFLGLDDDAEDAGGDKAEDKHEVTFKVFTSSKEKVYDYASGDWSMRIHYTLAK